MIELRKHISVESIDELVTLGHITAGLYELYQVDSAHDAQGILYELPGLYYDLLAQRRLLKSDDEDVANVSQQLGYDVHVGIVCLEDSRYMKRRFQRLQALADGITLYGLDTIEALERSPF